MIDGGWLLPLGQEDSLAPLVKVYRRLPAERFETIPSAPQSPESGPSNELIVRTLAKGDKTYFYALNPTPWPVTAEIRFAASQPLRLTPYSDERRANLQPTDGGANWTVEMEPFDLVGGEVSGGRATAVGWKVTPPPSAALALNDQVRDIKRRAHFLREHAHNLELANPSFAQRSLDGAIPGWVHARGAGMLVEIDSIQGSAAPGCLHVISRASAAPVWIRSAPFQSPTTGRIQMSARIRIANAAQQPQLRLAIECRHEDQVYYRRTNVGAKEHDNDPAFPPLTTQWATYSITVPDLPMSALTECRVGFDLMGDGECWIDDVQVQDLWLQGEEFDELLKSALTAKLQADSGRLNECRLFVDGYWPSFLRRHVQVPDGPDEPPIPAAALKGRGAPASAARSPQPQIAPPPTPPAGQRPVRSAERVRSWWPTWPWK
jgi:hypothetical protein